MTVRIVTWNVNSLRVRRRVRAIEDLGLVDSYRVLHPIGCVRAGSIAATVRDQAV